MTRRRLTRQTQLWSRVALVRRMEASAGRAYFGAQNMIEVDVTMAVAKRLAASKPPNK